MNGPTIAPLLALLALGSGCAVTDTSDIDFPREAKVSYLVTIDRSAGKAQCMATFDFGSESLDLSEGEKVYVNGTRMDKRSGLGIFYSASVERVAPGALYRFELEVPGKDTYVDAVAMVTDADVGAPTNGQSVSAAQDLVVTWSAGEVGTEDRVEVHLDANSGGSSTTDTWTASSGQTSLAVPADWLGDAFDEASGPDRAGVDARLTLKRVRTNAAGSHFRGGEVEVRRTLDEVDVRLDR